MLLTKFKIATAVLLAVGMLATGAGVLVQHAAAEKPTNQFVPAKPVDAEKKPAEPPAKKDPADTKKVPTLTGLVHGVDAAKGTITVTVAKGDASSEYTFKLGKEAKVYLDGKEAKLGDLKPGSPVTLQVSEDNTTALRVTVQGPSIVGDLKTVDAAKNTVVVTVKTSTGPQDKTYEVAKDATVSISGKKESTLADLKAGTSASLTLSADKSKVIAIASPAKKVDPGKKEGAK